MSEKIDARRAWGKEKRSMRNEKVGVRAEIWIRSHRRVSSCVRFSSPSTGCE